MTEQISLPVLTEPGKEIKIAFSGKLQYKHVTAEPYILIGFDGHSKCPVVRICKSIEAGEVIKLLESFMNLYGVPKKKNGGGSAFIPKIYREFCKNKNIEIEKSPPRLHTGTVAVERSIQALKNLIIANLEDKIGFTESVNRAL